MSAFICHLSDVALNVQSASNQILPLSPAISDRQSSSAQVNVSVSFSSVINLLLVVVGQCHLSSVALFSASDQ
jgi:hypothetical protein